MTVPVVAPRIVALSGGVGGAKLAWGLAQILPPEDLLIVANTGDDFVHLGLHVSPDIDSLVYALAGLGDAERGWGRAGESWNFMAALRALGEPDWFQLGDRDLAMHAARTRRLAVGETLSAITAVLASKLGVAHRIAPMSDQPIRTIVLTPDGELEFQHWFVREQCWPRVAGMRFVGAAAAQPSPTFATALASARLAAVVICPSNPFISIDPILAVPGVRSAIERLAVPVIAVTPIVGGKAVKGPAGKLLLELAGDASAVAVARHYGDMIDGLVLDARDVHEEPRVRALGLDVLAVDTIMHGPESKIALARATLEFAARLLKLSAAAE